MITKTSPQIILAIILAYGSASLLLCITVVHLLNPQVLTDLLLYPFIVLICSEIELKSLREKADKEVLKQKLHQLNLQVDLILREKNEH